ncbi:MAG: endonuclease V [Candidatus Hodarchaeota archaeon]
MAKSQLIIREDYVKNPKIMLVIAVNQKAEKIQGGGILYDLELKTQIESWIGEEIEEPAPYIPTFLTLRNKPALIPVINYFWGKFDLVLVEGTGIQHPAFCGLASEIGVDFDVSTIGITKKSLVGEIDWTDPYKETANEHEVFPIYYKNQLLAYFIRKKRNKRGIFLSQGHKISLKTAIDIILPLIRFRIPEPLRQLKILFKSF